MTMTNTAASEAAASHQIRNTMANPNTAVAAPRNIGTGVFSGISMSSYSSGAALVRSLSRRQAHSSRVFTFGITAKL